MPTSPSTASARFNGAATFQSQRLTEYFFMMIAPITLQWGRDLSVAETTLSLSDGVTPEGLQWGRDLSVAETSVPEWTPSRLCRRFNGAATFQSQRPPGGGARTAAGVQLQWGRDLSVAETSRRWVDKD